jgi:integrase
MGRLQYGAGLRVNELLRLRVKDLDFDRVQLSIRGAREIKLGSRSYQVLWLIFYKYKSNKLEFCMPRISKLNLPGQV